MNNELHETHKNPTVVVDMGAGESSCDILTEKSPTLATTHYGEPVACISMDNDKKDVTCLQRRFSTVNVFENGKTPTLEAGAGEGGNNAPMVCNDMDNERRSGAKISDNLAPTLSARAGTGGNNVPAIGEATVRRLTPLECERLQGYPDGFTDIGDWVDSKGKKHKGDADAPRYKALGNSIALPFWEWMAERMLKVLNEDKPTMASLFDGIGGFPLVYSRHGCEPVWASEIEEFPIAVTKRRFGDDNTDRE